LVAMEKNGNRAIFVNCGAMISPRNHQLNLTIVFKFERGGVTKIFRLGISVFGIDLAALSSQQVDQRRGAIKGK